MRVTLNEESQSLWQSQQLEHLRYEYDFHPDDIVIDLGAYRGEWALEIHRRYGCKIVMVEPGPWILGCNAGEIINKAAWLFDGKIKVGGAFYYTSVFEDWTHEYECFDINLLLARFEEVALLKINIEGAEYNLLTHIIDQGYINRIKRLQVQFHLIEGQQSEQHYELVADGLRTTHELEWCYPFCWESWRRA